ncbi:MAG: hypothetical protein R6U15_00990 [Candidatus Izemoplasmatales bacterium]
MDFVDFFLVVTLICLIVGIIFLFLKLKKYNFRVIIRELSGSSRLISMDKGAILETAKNYQVFKLLKSNVKLPVPSKDVIDITNKGKYFLELYRDKEGNYFYIKDRGSFKSFTPISTNRNSMLADEIEKAKMKGASWKNNLPLIASVGGLVIIVALFIFGIGEPIKQMDDFYKSRESTILESQELQVELVQAINNLKNDVQRIDSRLETKEKINKTPPN